jgi:insulysin
LLGLICTYSRTLSPHTTQGALDRLGQFFTAPLLLREAVLDEIDNVHSEYSRNCNSDARKLLQVLHERGFQTILIYPTVMHSHEDLSRVLPLISAQLRRSCMGDPISKFSTGSRETLRERPLKLGLEVDLLVRQLWERRYTGGTALGSDSYRSIL